MLASMSKRMPRIWPCASSASVAGWRDVARLLVGEEHFAARADPLHRPAELLRREEQRAVFRIDVEAHAEAAADFLRDDAHLLRRHAEHRGELLAHDARALRAWRQEMVLGRVVTNAAWHARGSIGLPTTREMIDLELDLRAALANAAFGRRVVARFVIHHQLPGTASWTRGAPAR